MTDRPAAADYDRAAHSVTPQGYMLMREDYLDDIPTGHWPTVLGRSGDEAIAARAAWWTRLVAPRREAAADVEADAALEAAGRVWKIAGYNWFGDVWHHESTRDGDGVPGSTSRQLRARLAFDGATGVACASCHERGAFLDPRWNSIRGRCQQCDDTGRVLPEAVPQVDPARGNEPCGCVDTLALLEVVARPDGSVKYVRGCKWCGDNATTAHSAGTVRDGRRDDAGAREYAPGLGVPGVVDPHPQAFFGRTPQRELAHRREQPDAFGHPAKLRVIGSLPFDDHRPPLHSVTFVARAPLAETLHGERDAHDPETTTYRHRQSYGALR